MLATRLGEAFSRRATAILNDVRRTRDELSSCGATRLVPSRLGFRSRPIFGFCPKCWSPFGDGFPKVHLHIIEGFYPGSLSKDFRMAASISMSGQIRARIYAALYKQVLLSGRRAVLCRSRHPLANATSLKDLINAEWITTSITPRAEKELGVLFKRYGLPQPTLADAQSVGAHIIDVSCAFRPSSDGPRAMDNVAIRQSRVDGDPREGRTVRARDSFRDRIRRSTVSRCKFSHRSHQTRCRPYRIDTK